MPRAGLPATERERESGRDCDRVQRGDGFVGLDGVTRLDGHGSMDNFACGLPQTIL